ncbi:hypothetical protein WG66_015933 [Moniliophthora roreri]|nr:hypothetical protein WG66_015933 [Moniliophthora roreri]
MRQGRGATNSKLRSPAPRESLNLNVNVEPPLLTPKILSYVSYLEFEGGGMELVESQELEEAILQLGAWRSQILI